MALAQLSNMKVHNEKVSNSQLATFEFKKPVPTKPELTAFDPQFLTRLAEIEEKTYTVTLSSGREICYFDESGSVDGSPAALPVVLCIHGLGQSKELWIEPEPIPNVRLIAIDRMGHGSSSPQPVPYLFGDGVPEIGELMDKIGVEKFFVVGHSAGGPWALQVAAGLGNGDEGRVLGAASISGQCDLYHPTAPECGSKEWNSLVTSPMITKACGPDAGCWGGCIRNFLLKRVMGSMFYSEKKDQDFGFRQMYLENQRKGDGGCERTWEAMDNDPFFVSKNLYSTLHGCNDTTTPLGDIWRIFGKWDYDSSSFKGHCVVYNGDPETILVPMAEQAQRSIPQSDLVIMTGHGHTTIMLEGPTIIQALVAGKSAKQVY